MGYKLGSRSKNNLDGVHSDLVAVVERAISISEQDFTVIEGLRSRTRQRRLVDDGKSQTMNSRHITGHAVDLAAWVGGTISWKVGGKTEYYQKIARAMFEAAEQLRIKIRWGGDWDMDGDQSDERFRDMVHFELPRSFYG
jgi:peptidoglycan L-alanyl-D-glutamate endopeptidase CwlK